MLNIAQPGTSPPRPTKVRPHCFNYNQRLGGKSPCVPVINFLCAGTAATIHTSQVCAKKLAGINSKVIVEINHYRKDCIPRDSSC